MTLAQHAAYSRIFLTPAQCPNDVARRLANNARLRYVRMAY